MAKILPFRAMRYNTAKAGEINTLVSLPYDRIKHELQGVYYDRNPFNIVRVIKGRETPDDNIRQNVYTRAGEFWRSWLAAGVVTQEEDPAIYAYYQTFTVDGVEHTRRGMSVLVELEDYATGKVKAHERTLEGPKADRLKLLQATHTHYGQIFQLYPDDTNEVADLLEPETAGEPLVDAQIPEEDARHRVWAVTDRRIIGEVQELMRDKLLSIADGHHRYETALNYRNWAMEHYNIPDEGHSPRYAMMTLVGMSDPGLVVLPTLRIIYGLKRFALEDLLAGLNEHFAVSEEPDIDAMQAKLDAAAADKSHNAFGLYCGGRYWFFELTDREIMTRVAGKQSDDWRSLDVAVLHEVVLERLLGITKEAQAAKTNIDYERDRDRGKAMVDDGSHQCMFYMNPTLLSQIRNVAGEGEVMPQKSTDFFPKLLTGLCACPVELGTPKG
jgi:uncharacterized protein (DUF1015 family)